MAIEYQQYKNGNERMSSDMASAGSGDPRQPMDSKSEALERERAIQAFLAREAGQKAISSG